MTSVQLESLCIHWSIIVLCINTVAEAFSFCDEGALQNYPTLLVPLRLLRRELVDPAKLGIAILAGDITHHVTPRQHHAILHLAEAKVYDTVEQKSSTSGAGKSS